jgi:RNA recognition motif-containing protein
MSIRIYVGNLPKDVEREELEAVFSDHVEEIVSVKLISDRKTGKCRGFGFVTVKTDEQADAIVEKFTGHTLQENVLKIEKALPRKSGEEGEATPAVRRKGGSKSASTRTPAASTGGGDVQPDPRWAGDLAKLKELLAAQTTAP